MTHDGVVLLQALKSRRWRRLLIYIAILLQALTSALFVKWFVIG